MAETLVVSTTADAGDGSLRAALAMAAQQEEEQSIAIEVPGDIKIEEPLIYHGLAPLELLGNGQRVVADRNFTLLQVTRGAELRITDLTLQGPGGFSVTTPSSGSAGKGIFVDLRDDQSGTYRMSLEGVVVRGVAGHGIHISDCDDIDGCADGSDASIAVNLRDVTVFNVGNGSFDADGIRIDERGPGDIQFEANDLVVERAGADGVELDERQSGDVTLQVDYARFIENGAYCEPDVLTALLPDPAEDDFDDGERDVSRIPAAVVGSPDDRCFERDVDYYDDGSVEAYEFSIDVDDGFDIDEAGPGHILGTFDGMVVRGNLDQGIDFDEEDAGMISVEFFGGVFQRNSDDGLKLSEEDDGSVTVVLERVALSSNGGNGTVIEEEDAGDVAVNVRSSAARGNGDGDETGLVVDEDDAGNAVLNLRWSDITDGIDADGVVISED